MPFFKIFRNPVAMIQIMSDIQVAGKQYKKNPGTDQQKTIEKLIRFLEGQFDKSGVPSEITHAHSGILFEMAIKGENIPPLAALEHALMETLEENDLEFGYVEDGQVDGLTEEQNREVDAMIKNLEKEEGDG